MGEEIDKCPSDGSSLSGSSTAVCIQFYIKFKIIKMVFRHPRANSVSVAIQPFSIVTPHSLRGPLQLQEMPQQVRHDRKTGAYIGYASSR